MSSNFLAAFVAPTIALAALGLGGAPGGSEGGEAYGSAVERLSKDAARADARALFARADLDDSGRLDIDEFAALTVVLAELGRVNGFVCLEIDGEPRTVALPSGGAKDIAVAERARIDAVARRDFHLAAGADASMSAEEFAAERDARFAAADRNRNGVLARVELKAYAARLASIAGAGA